MKKISIFGVIAVLVLTFNSHFAFAVDPAPSATTVGTPNQAPSPTTVKSNPDPSSATTVGTPKQPPSPTTVTNTTSNFYLQNPLSSKFSSIGGIVNGFLEILTYLAIILAVLLIIWTGLQFILAQGNSTKISELKTQLTWIVIGVAIIIGARIIVAVVVNTLEKTNVVSDPVIQSAHKALNGQ